MICRIPLQDWLHESCLNLRERPPSREPTPVGTLPDVPSSAESAPTQDDDDIQSEASSSGLPPPLITDSDYETLICGSCVSSIPILKRWAGTKGIMMVVRDNPEAVWRILDGSPDDRGTADEDILIDGEKQHLLGTKRPLSDTTAAEPSNSKKPRLSPGSSSSASPTCLEPPSNSIAQDIFDDRRDSSQSIGYGDIFLTDNWRTRWCRCESCLPALRAHPYLLEEENTYEPPEDPDSQLSLEELGLRALERLPRDRALDGIRAFNDMRDDLVRFLRPFAQEGKVVAEEDIRTFFESKTEAARQSPEN